VRKSVVYKFMLLVGMGASALFAEEVSAQTPCEEMLGQDSCIFMPTAQRLALPVRRPAAPPLPERKPVIITPEAAILLAQPGALDQIIANFAHRFDNYYDVDATGVAIIAEGVLAQFAIAGGSNAGVDAAVTNGVDVLMGETDPENVADALLAFGETMLHTWAGEVVGADPARTPIGRQLAPLRADLRIAAAEGTGTLVAMFLFAVADTINAEASVIPRELIEQELLYIRSRCNDGSIVRATPGLFFSPVPNEVHVRMGLADCDWQEPLTFCTSEGCERRVWRVTDGNFFLVRTELEGADRQDVVPDVVRQRVRASREIERAMQSEARRREQCSPENIEATTRQYSFVGLVLRAHCDRYPNGVGR
jgi:hypothetical protein